MVEKNGDQMSQVLTSSNPWGEQRCERHDCLSCTHSEKEIGQCRKRNLVYETKCKICKERGETSIYIGETARSLYERQREHLRDSICLREDTKSHMKEHWETSHRERGQLETIEDTMKVFEVKILERYKSSLDRQIGETIYIRGAQGTVLNDRDEFNRCELPVLSVSKQTNKAPTNSRDREIMEETDRLQELRPETQFKRQQISEGDRETEMNEAKKDRTEMKEPVKKRQRRHAVPRRTTWKDRRQTETRDIRYKEKDSNRDVRTE